MPFDQFKTRDGEPLDSVYESYREELKDYFKRFGKDTEDLVQDVYCRLLRQRRLSEVRNPKYFLFWLARLVMRSASPRRTKEARLMVSGNPRELEELLAAQSLQSEDKGLAEVDEAALRRNIAALPPEQRLLIQLRCFEHLTIPEISTRTGIKQNTVKSHLKKALRTLRQCYGAEALSKQLRQQQRKAP